MVTTSTASALAPATPRYVLGWAFLGLCFILLEIYVFGAWVTSEDFAPSPVGDDPLPGYTAFWVTFFEILSPIMVIGVLAWAIREYRRAGQITLPIIILVSWSSLWWQDPMINWARPVFFYNAHFFNMGNWTNQIPGWVNPTSHMLPEPILWMGLMYVWLPLIITFMLVACLNQAKRLIPGLTVFQLICVGFLFTMTLDLILELFWVRTGVYAYPGTIHSLSIWGGETYQFPIYESLFWGPMWALTGLLYFFRDDKGHTWVDKGIEKVRNTTLHTPIRIFALIGFINFCFAIYNVFMIWITFQVDPTPAGYPSYLLSGLCGEGTQYECAGPNVPISLPGSAPTLPFTGNN